MLRKFLIPKIYLPIIIGLIIGGFVINFGENDSSKIHVIIVLLGMISTIFFIFIGLYNIAKESKKSIVIGIIFFIVSAFGAIHTIYFYCIGELNDSPGVGVIILTICICLFIVGITFINKTNE